ncbi:MAG TPA: DUF4397 domain-containing protein, partial [Aggregatilineales bacterium]|nr:DUF4397 domain-containing protein [Aggregatilineales bacterium]
MQFKIRRSALTPWLALVFALALTMQSGVTQAASAGGRLRFVHAVPGAPAVDVAIDNQSAVLSLDYATNTRYLNLAPGNHAIAVMATGTTSAVFKGQVTLAAGQSQTAVLQGTANALELGLYDDDLGPLAPGNIRFTAIHAIKDAPAVDILKADGSPLIQGLKYGAPYGGFDVPAAAASILVVPAGGNPSGAIIKADGLSLVAGTFNTLVAVGTVTGS